MGIGVLWLLQKIDICGSMKKAAEEMDLSYAKAHRMIRDAEEGFGVPLIYRKRGGDSRKGADLTEDARLIMKAYSDFQEEIKSDAAGRFATFFERIGQRLGLEPAEQPDDDETSATDEPPEDSPEETPSGG